MSAFDAGAFVSGANLPWGRYGCDFGANPWQPSGGLSSNGTRARVESALDAIRDGGGRLVRWFIFADGRAGLRFDDASDRVEMDASLWRDLELALDLVSVRGLQLLPSLFDFHWCMPARVVNGVQLGGRRCWWAQADKRARLLEAVVGPVIERFATHPAIWAWEIANEPEWVTRGAGGRIVFGSLSRSSMRAWLRLAVAAIRARSTVPVTIGTATGKGLALVDDLGLDVLQLHWYDRLAPEGPWTALSPVTPTLLGEFPSRGSAWPVERVLELARAAGYVGALPWSMLAEDAWSDGPRAMEEARRWAGVPSGAEAPDAVG